MTLQCSSLSSCGSAGLYITVQYRVYSVKCTEALDQLSCTAQWTVYSTAEYRVYSVKCSAGLGSTVDSVQYSTVQCTVLQFTAAGHLYITVYGVLKLWVSWSGHGHYTLNYTTLLYSTI